MRIWCPACGSSNAGEVVPGDRITVKTDFEEKTGTVKEVHLRNVVVELESGEDLLIEATKVFEEDVIRERNKRGKRNEMGWKAVECPVCGSTVVVRENEEVRCPHCGELIKG